MPQNKKKAKIKTHDYGKHASKYAELGIDDTNYLAFRDIPQLIQKHAKGLAALDYGCGAGRSTRFLNNLGLHVVGVDISQDMLDQPVITISEASNCPLKTKVLILFFPVLYF